LAALSTIVARGTRSTRPLAGGWIEASFEAVPLERTRFPAGPTVTTRRVGLRATGGRTARLNHREQTYFGAASASGRHRGGALRPIITVRSWIGSGRRLHPGGGRPNIQLAREFGFCSGWTGRGIAYETRTKFPERRVFLVGEIIHNPHVIRTLQADGGRVSPPAGGVSSIFRRSPDGRGPSSGLRGHVQGISSGCAPWVRACRHDLRIGAERLEARGCLREKTASRRDSRQVLPRVDEGYSSQSPKYPAGSTSLCAI